jgi:hypothetical protein
LSRLGSDRILFPVLEEVLIGSKNLPPKGKFDNEFPKHLSNINQSKNAEEETEARAHPSGKEGQEFHVQIKAGFPQ